MQLKHEFTINRPLEDVWTVLTDLGTVAQALPGASIEDVESDGTHRGKLRVKLGSVAATFNGDARYTSIDNDSHQFTLEGSGKSQQGNAVLRLNGGASSSQGDRETSVTLNSSIELTGRVAQFGASMASDVARQLLDIFVENLTRGFEPQSTGHTSSLEGDAKAGGDNARPVWRADTDNNTFDLGASILPGMSRQLLPVLVGAVTFLIGVAVGRTRRAKTPAICAIIIEPVVRRISSD